MADKSVRLGEYYGGKFKELMEREGFTTGKSLGEAMVQFFLRNNISVRDDVKMAPDTFVGDIKKYSEDNTDRIIKILKSLEKGYLMPSNRDLGKANSMLEYLVENTIPDDDIKTEGNKHNKISEIKNKDQEKENSLFNTAKMYLENLVKVYYQNSEGKYMLKVDADEFNKVKLFLENV